MKLHQETLSVFNLKSLNNAKDEIDTENSNILQVDWKCKKVIENIYM